LNDKLNPLAKTILENSLNQKEIRPELKEDNEHSKKILDSLATDYLEASRNFKRNCANPASFSAAMHATLTSSSYVEAIRKII